MCRCRQVSQTRSKTYRLASVGILGKKKRTRSRQTRLVRDLKGIFGSKFRTVFEIATVY